MASTISQGLLLTIALAPLAGALVAGLAGKAVGTRGAHTVTIVGVLLAFFALGVTGFLIWWLRGIKDTRLALSLGLIIGGALGNVIDRILYGAVADFFYLHACGYGWYVFNVADTAVVMGVVIMALDLVIGEWRSRVRGAKEDQT